MGKQVHDTAMTLSTCNRRMCLSAHFVRRKFVAARASAARAT